MASETFGSDRAGRPALWFPGRGARRTLATAVLAVGVAGVALAPGDAPLDAPSRPALPAAGDAVVVGLPVGARIVPVATDSPAGRGELGRDFWDELDRLDRGPFRSRGFFAGSPPVMASAARNPNQVRRIRTA